MRKTFLATLFCLAFATIAQATPPLRFDSIGAVKARSLIAVDGGVNAGGLSEFNGGLTGTTFEALAPPTPTVAGEGASLDGGTTYTYAIAACSTATCAAGSESALGTGASNTASAATLSSGNGNIITIPAVVGAQAFAVWRQAPAGATMGLLAVVPQTACSNAGDFCGATYTDIGGAPISDSSPDLAGNGDAGPTIDLSGSVVAPSMLIAGVRSIPTWATCSIANSTTCTATVPAGSHCGATLSAVSDGGSVVPYCSVSSTTATCTVSANTTASFTLLCD